MGRAPCCSKVGLRKGAWSSKEDDLLINYIQTHGEGQWRSLPQKAGLLRCGKSCRLRWMNYLRPGVKRGNITPEEENLIIRLQSLLGNRWSIIAGKLPGRTDNEIKNHWNTNILKRLEKEGIKPNNKCQLKSIKNISANNDLKNNIVIKNPPQNKHQKDHQDHDEQMHVDEPTKMCSCSCSSSLSSSSSSSAEPRSATPVEPLAIMNSSNNSTSNQEDQASKEEELADHHFRSREVVALSEISSWSSFDLQLQDEQQNYDQRSVDLELHDEQHNLLEGIINIDEDNFDPSIQGEETDVQLNHNLLEQVYNEYLQLL